MGSTFYNHKTQVTREQESFLKTYKSMDDIMMKRDSVVNIKTVSTMLERHHLFISYEAAVASSHAANNSPKWVTISASAIALL